MKPRRPAPPEGDADDTTRVAWLGAPCRDCGLRAERSQRACYRMMRYCRQYDPTSERS